MAMFDPYDPDDEGSYEDADFDGDEESDLALQFADPGGRSALRAATPDNPRIYPCPTCDEPNRLTAKDVQLGYQCDSCADAAEGGF